jgi:hypothetical protein
VLQAAGLPAPAAVGHGLGVAPRQAPWLAAGSEVALPAGAVVALVVETRRGRHGVVVGDLVQIGAAGPVSLTRLARRLWL